MPKKSIFVGGAFNFDIDEVIGFDDVNLLVQEGSMVKKVSINEDVRKKFGFDQI